MRCRGNFIIFFFRKLGELIVRNEGKRINFEVFHLNYDREANSWRLIYLQTASAGSHINHIWYFLLSLLFLSFFFFFYVNSSNRSNHNCANNRWFLFFCYSLYKNRLSKGKFGRSEFGMFFCFVQNKNQRMRAKEFLFIFDHFTSKCNKQFQMNKRWIHESTVKQMKDS